MSMHYSDPSRANDPHALPDCEVFFVDPFHKAWKGYERGYYYWFCFPGCLPDGDPVGPFKTAALAIADCRDY